MSILGGSAEDQPQRLRCVVWQEVLNTGRDTVSVAWCLFSVTTLIYFQNLMFIRNEIFRNVCINDAQPVNLSILTFYVPLCPPEELS